MKVNTMSAHASAAVAILSHVAHAIDVDWTSKDSVKSAASTVAYDMMTYYTGNVSGEWNIPGILPASPAYYWWESGAMWNTLIDYWHITGDSSYNDVTSQGMLFQVGPYQDYMPPNQSKQLGNDDQGFWGFAAMAAAEANFPDPPAGKPQWLALAQAVFNEYVVRWAQSGDSCGGGLKWQIYSFNAGYDYKNSIANGCFFNLGARLARYTENSTYSTWANTVWDWVERVGLIDVKYNVFDGTNDVPYDSSGVYQNCSVINHLQYSYNPAVWLLGAANMYNITTGDEQARWKTRVDGLLQQAIVIFAQSSSGIFVEVSCENQTPITCTTDMLIFKGILCRNLAAAAIIAPWISDDVTKVVDTNAKAAAQQCSGGSNGRTCGFKWTMTNWDGTNGAGQEMNALNAIISTGVLKGQNMPPVTNSSGGTSSGNVNAGNLGTTSTPPEKGFHITKADRVGAGIITTIVLLMAVGSMWWMIVD